MQEIKQIKYNSPEYFKSFKLRNEILRKPLGMILTKEFILKDKDDLIFVLLENNEVLATLNYSHIGKYSLKMRQLAVKSSLQGKGYGTLLVKFSENNVREFGYSRIELHARENAVNFYMKFDFKIIGEPFYEVGILHYKMIRGLD